MDVSDLRKRILRALDDARRDAVVRREVNDAAAQAYEAFLTGIGVPLVRQAADVLNAAREPFAVHTPASGVRLASEKTPQTFIEIELDSAGARPQVIGRVSLDRGRRGVLVEERPVAVGKPVADVNEEDVAAFLAAEIPKLVIRP